MSDRQSPLDPRFVDFAASRDRSLRNQLIEDHRGLAYHVADRYSNRGLPLDDLRQVAVLGLLRSIERFDPARGVAFSTFALRTIEGTLKEHFRDATWTLRVPRSAKERSANVRIVEDELTQRLGRSPTVAELAAEADLDPDQVIEALTTSQAYRTSSLDPPSNEPDGAWMPKAPDATASFDEVDSRVVLAPLLDRLAPREREIVELHYFDHLSQAAIAERIGISQMHVSRLLRRSLLDMRAGGTADSEH